MHLRCEYRRSTIGSFSQSSNTRRRLLSLSCETHVLAQDSESSLQLYTYIPIHGQFDLSIGLLCIRYGLVCTVDRIRHRELTHRSQLPAHLGALMGCNFNKINDNSSLYSCEQTDREIGNLKIRWRTSLRYRGVRGTTMKQVSVTRNFTFSTISQLLSLPYTEKICPDCWLPGQHNRTCSFM